MKSLSPIADPATTGASRPMMLAPHDENGTSTVIGAAVESTMYASFALETLLLSVSGRDTWPTARALK